MQLRPLQPQDDARFYISGNVTIHPSAAIAPGVFLQADPDSEILIAAGVCIGKGSILHAYQGILEIGSGSILGTQVLVIGKGTIGVNACIGSMSTIWNCSVEPGKVVPPHSVVGQMGRLGPELEAEGETPNASAPAPAQPQKSSHSNKSASSENSSQGFDAESAGHSQNGRIVYGQASLERLMVMLFPYGRTNDRLPQSGQPSSRDTLDQE